jgi:hypothetical protein
MPWEKNSRGCRITMLCFKDADWPRIDSRLLLFLSQVSFIRFSARSGFLLKSAIAATLIWLPE